MAADPKGFGDSMSIPHKGSRLVDVDGKPFRFMVKERVAIPGSDSPHGPADQKLIWVTVQEDVEEPGRPMQYTWPYGHAVTPEDVRTAVRDGMKAGWDPSSRGAAFQFVKGG